MDVCKAAFFGQIDGIISVFHDQNCSKNFDDNLLLSLWMDSGPSIVVKM